MRAFQTIKLGGVEWCIYGKSDDAMYLCTAKSVASFVTTGAGNGSRSPMTDLKKELNSKFMKKLCAAGLAYTDFAGPLSILSEDDVRSIYRLGFTLPAIPEAFYLVSKKGDADYKETNYFLVADNNGDIHHEFENTKIGVRATACIKRSVLSADENEYIRACAVALDKTDKERTGRLTAKRLEKIYRRQHKKNSSIISDTVYRLRYHIVLCNVHLGELSDVLLWELKDLVSKPNSLCDLKECFIESASVGREYISVMVNAPLTTNVTEIIGNIKKCALPQSLLDDRSFLDKLFNKQIKFWQEGCLVDTEEIPLATISEYLSTFAKEDRKCENQ